MVCVIEVETKKSMQKISLVLFLLFSFNLFASKAITINGVVLVNGSYIDHPRSHYSNFYIMFCVLKVVCVYVGILLTVGHFYLASKTIHKTLQERIFKAPMPFFASTPVGK